MPLASKPNQTCNTTDGASVLCSVGHNWCIICLECNRRMCVVLMVWVNEKNTCLMYDVTAIKCSVQTVKWMALLLIQSTGLLPGTGICCDDKRCRPLCTLKTGKERVRDMEDWKRAIVTHAVCPRLENECVCVCACASVWACVCDEMSGSLCLCKHSGLLRDGAPSIVIIIKTNVHVWHGNWKREWMYEQLKTSMIIIVM